MLSVIHDPFAYLQKGVEEILAQNSTLITARKG
jgi:hypothetical protein